jgi:hypothetical protein
MAKIPNTAQMIMDIYYASFKTDEDFFTIFHFEYLVGVAYAQILEQEYREQRREAKQETGYTEIALQSDMLIEKELDVQRRKGRDGEYYIELPSRPFTFPYDPYGFGVQTIRSTDSKCTNFVRATAKIDQQLCVMPKVSRIFFYPLGKNIELRNLYCHLSKAIVTYLPDITDPQLGEDAEIPKSKEDVVIRQVLQMMLAARQGQVVDMSNNSNPNKVMQSEIDNIFNKIRQS